MGTFADRLDRGRLGHVPTRAWLAGLGRVQRAVRDPDPDGLSVTATYLANAAGSAPGAGLVRFDSRIMKGGDGGG